METAASLQKRSLQEPTFQSKIWVLQTQGEKIQREGNENSIFLFGRVLKGPCYDNDIALNRVDSYRTSKWCIRCGAVGAGHATGNYALFRCEECGLTMNADRKASVAVAARTLLELRGNPDGIDGLQISGRRAPVSGLIRVSDALGPLAVPTLIQGRGKPTGTSRGQLTWPVPLPAA
jgi:hypothetical protein